MTKRATESDQESGAIAAGKASRAMPPTKEADVRVKSLIGPTKGEIVNIPYSAAQSGVASGFYARAEGEVYPADFPGGAPPVMATKGTLAPTPEAVAEEVSGTVDDATAHVAAAADLPTLDAIEQAEKDGKARKGVLSAIDKRRAELDPTFGTVGDVSERVATLDAEQLAAAEQTEKAGRARKGVLSAIEARRAALSAEADVAKGTATRDPDHGL